ncbi:MAG: DUF2073 domain-containing protein [Candidatus Jordarchaeales archaeon]|nr:DUF2073 domain-containing protein [Candidatus Jordarchaeia archaeon]
MKIDIISEKVTRRLSPNDKVKMIIERVKGKSILVLEERLKPEEQAELIKETMLEIDFKEFNGIEVITFNGEKKGGKITVVAPSDIVAVTKEGDFISLMYVAGCTK